MERTREELAFIIELSVRAAAEYDRWAHKGRA